MLGLSGESAARALGLVAALRAAGHQALLVGGCVRDLLLGFEPKDFDIATDAEPSALVRLFPGADVVGAHFGVVLVDGVEIATFRSDGAYADGRHPEAVRFEKSPEADAARRDFTLNGLFYDPVAERVLDFVGGERDLRDGVIRAIGRADDRFAEDHLRLLRAVRFASRYGFVIEPETRAAIGRLAPLITRIAAERSKEELNRVLTQGGARRGAELLEESGLLLALLPEVDSLKSVPGLWERTLGMLERMEQPSLSLAWGVLLHGVGKPPSYREGSFEGYAERGARLAVSILVRLRQSNELVHRVRGLVAGQEDWAALRELRESALRRFLRRDGFAEHLELHRLSAGGETDSYAYALARLERLTPAELWPSPLLNGDDLIAAGLTPGASFRRILEAVEDAQLEDGVRTRDEALRLALTLAGNSELPS